MVPGRSWHWETLGHSRDKRAEMSGPVKQHFQKEPESQHGRLCRARGLCCNPWALPGQHGSCQGHTDASGHGCLPTNLYFYKNRLGQIWPSTLPYKVLKLMRTLAGTPPELIQHFYTLLLPRASSPAAILWTHRCLFLIFISFPLTLFHKLDLKPR